MNKKVARIGLLYYLSSLLLSLLFSRYLPQNAYFIFIHLGICIVFLYVIFIVKMNSTNK